MTTAPPRWATGVATIIGVAGRTIRIQCPHCGRRHNHGRNMAGSRHIIAGCHTGYTRCRTYAIPELPRHEPTSTPHDPTRGKGVNIATHRDPGRRSAVRGSLPPAESGKSA